MIFADKSILDRVLSPWIVELTRRIKPQQKADVEDRLRWARYPNQTAGDYYGTKLVNGFLDFGKAGRDYRRLSLAGIDLYPDCNGRPWRRQP